MESSATNSAEAVLIARILNGEAQLYHELIRPFERTIYMMALRLVKNEADAEDVAQEAFIKAYRNLSNFRADAKFGTWMISIALNEARNRLRRQAIVPMQSLDQSQDREGGHVSPALFRDWREIPSEALERNEVKALLQSAVQSLPEMYREVFTLRDVEELDVKETAEVLQITQANVKVRLHRAHIMLQRQLAPALKAAVPAPKRRWFPWS